MEFKTLMTINAVIAISTGIACILAPAQLLATYGVSLDSMGLVIYQFWGTFLLGLGLLAGSARIIEERKVQRAIASSLAITYGISCGIAVKGQFAGANIMGWSTVVLFLLLASSFVLLRFRWKSADSHHPRIAEAGIRGPSPNECRSGRTQTREHSVPGSPRDCK